MDAVTLIGEQSFFDFATLVLFGCFVVHIFATRSACWPCKLGGFTGLQADAATALGAGFGIDAF